MDAGYVDEFGYVYVTARDDDVINVAGHRLSTAALENVIMGHPDVADATVVGVPEPTKGEVPFCFFVLRNGESSSKDWNAEKKAWRINNIRYINYISRRYK